MASKYKKPPHPCYNHLMARRYPKIGIALGSGGAKGLAHIGDLKRLEYYGIPISFVAGSSIGSLIGAYYAAHPHIEKLEEFILSFDLRKGFGLFDPTLRGGLMKGNKWEQLISDLLEGATFEKLQIPLSVVATDFNTAETVVISKGDLVKAIRASISVPAIFQPITLENKLLADGGLSQPIPDEVVRKMGSDIVISVNLDHLYSPTTVAKTPSLGTIPMHAIEILRHNLALSSMQSSDIIISPKLPAVGLIGWNYLFDNQKAQQIIKAGEDAVDEMLPEIRLLIDLGTKDKTLLKKIFSFLNR